MKNLKLVGLSVFSAGIVTFGLLAVFNGSTGTEQGLMAEAKTAQRRESGIKNPLDQSLNQPEAAPEQSRSEKLTQTAQFLAGMKLDEDSPLAGLQETERWLEAHSALERAWNRLNRNQLSKIREWSTLNMADTGPEHVFYPFSGPDFLYAVTLFPEAREYILIGLESTGEIPEISELDPDRSLEVLEAVNDGVTSILQITFFRTKEMETDMQEQGVLPAVLIFLARTDHSILDIEYIGISEEGICQPHENGMIPGIRISFQRNGVPEPRMLYYFSTDLSNAGVRRNPGLSKFVKQLEQPITFLKAASYLMHYTSYSKIRDLVLSQSQVVLQDDSGVPIRYFTENGDWQLKLFGAYFAPESPFNEEEFQQDLMDLYQSSPDIQGLDFGIGYNFRPGQSNLLLATKVQEEPSF